MLVVCPSIFVRQLQLVLALAVRAQSQAGGVSKTNAYINVLDAFTTHVLPEIQVGGEGREGALSLGEKLLRVKLFNMW